MQMAMAGVLIECAFSDHLVTVKKIMWFYDRHKIRNYTCDSLNSQQIMHN
jgi:hypothetical protein